MKFIAAHMRQREITLTEPCLVGREINDLPRHQYTPLPSRWMRPFTPSIRPFSRWGAIIHAERPWPMSCASPPTNSEANSGHWLMEEQPDARVQVITAFLKASTFK